MERIVHPVSNRPNEQEIAAYRRLLDGMSPSCVVADSMEREGVLRSDIRPLVAARIAGPALTVHLVTGDLVDCLDALEVAQADDVIVVDAGGETETAVWGGLMSRLSQMKGVAGAIIDGAARDVDEIRQLGFPVFSRALVPRSTHSPFSKRTIPIEVNVPVHCGGILVFPGDIIIGDEVGVVAVPFAVRASVLERAQAQMAQEEMTRQRISEGRSVEELLAEFGRL